MSIVVQPHIPQAPPAPSIAEYYAYNAKYHAYNRARFLNKKIAYLDSHESGSVKWMKVAQHVINFVSICFIAAIAILPFFNALPNWLPWTGLGFAFVFEVFVKGILKGQIKGHSATRSEALSIRKMHERWWPKGSAPVSADQLPPDPRLRAHHGNPEMEMFHPRLQARTYFSGLYAQTNQVLDPNGSIKDQTDGILDRGGNLKDFFGSYHLEIGNLLKGYYAAAEDRGMPLVDRGVVVNGTYKNIRQLKGDLEILQRDLYNAIKHIDNGELHLQYLANYIRGFNLVRSALYKMPSAFTDNSGSELLPDHRKSYDLLKFHFFERYQQFKLLKKNFDRTFDTITKGKSNDFTYLLNNCWNTKEKLKAEKKDEYALRQKGDHFYGEVESFKGILDNPSDNELQKCYSKLASLNLQQEQRIALYELWFERFHLDNVVERISKKILTLISKYLDEARENGFKFQKESLVIIRNALRNAEKSSLETLIEVAQHFEGLRGKVDTEALEKLLPEFIRFGQFPNKDSLTEEQYDLALGKLIQFNSDADQLLYSLFRNDPPAPPLSIFRRIHRMCLIAWDTISFSSSTKPFDRIEQTHNRTWMTINRADLKAADTKYVRIYMVHNYVLTFLVFTVLAFVQYAYFHNQWVHLSVGAALLAMMPIRGLTSRLLERVNREINRIRLKEMVLEGPLNFNDPRDYKVGKALLEKIDRDEAIPDIYLRKESPRLKDRGQIETHSLEARKVLEGLRNRAHPDAPFSQRREHARMELAGHLAYLKALESQGLLSEVDMNKTRSREVIIDASIPRRKLYSHLAPADRDLVLESLKKAPATRVRQTVDVTVEGDSTIPARRLYYQPESG